MAATAVLAKPQLQKAFSRQNTKLHLTFFRFILSSASYLTDIQGAKHGFLLEKYLGH